MGRLRGETVGVVSETVTRDLYGNPAKAGVTEWVDDVLVAPADSKAISELGAGTTWDLQWPKADTRDLFGKVLLIRGERFAVIGDPRAYQGDLTPGDWDRRVYARRAAQDGDAT